MSLVFLKILHLTQLLYLLEQLTLLLVSDFTPTQTGLYNFSYWATSDSFPTTDTTVMSAIVTDTVYGVDYDWASDGANAQGGYFLGKPCGGNVLGNVFDIYADATVTSISFHVNESSAFGSDVNVQLYNIDDPSVIDPILLEESDPYTTPGFRYRFMDNIKAS